MSLQAGTASLRELVRATKVEGARLRRVLRELAARGYILRTGRTAASRYHLLPFTHPYRMGVQEEPAEVHREPRCELEELIERLGTWAFAAMRWQRIPVGDCADLWQEAQLLACHRWKELENPEKWLRGTVRNLCIVYWRERRRSAEVAVGSLLEFGEIGPTESSPEEAVLGRMHLTQVLRRVKPRKAELVWRRFGLEESQEEIAAAMGLKKISVRKVTTRALKEVRQMSRQDDGKGLPRTRRKRDDAD
ncbi:MAG TPA: sigma-70 family RNA polymerase sigma factor [Thermoanaerobaculia bacterium]|nr:sigma-70 family RNA polymerase sigma factor [Thermoanaerobaculia bacterium]